ncbi:MAG: DUF975 family protein [Prevotellaceae bacterium]|jgi:uncharacterized membrane protein|nr:DUF975 family protein [Prevotellaceae bacterium]
MITENKELMAQARAALSGKWTVAVCATLIYMLLVFLICMASIVGIVVMLLIAGSFVLGFAMLFLALSRGEHVRIDLMFKGFSCFGAALAAYLLVLLFTFLWTLLLIVPGIIAFISYSQTFYILADNPGIDPMDAISKSKKMMQGYKWKYFCLHLRFIGWSLLCILTLGIGHLWLMPYMQTTFAKFYDDLKANQDEYI